MISRDGWHHLPCGAPLPESAASDVMPGSPVPYDEYLAMHSMMIAAGQNRVAAAILYHKIAGHPECKRLAELDAIHHKH